MNNPVETKAVNPKAYELLVAWLGPNNKIVDLEVHNRWLTATLRSGIRFSVVNPSRL